MHIHHTYLALLLCVHGHSPLLLPLCWLHGLYFNAALKCSSSPFFFSLLPLFSATPLSSLSLTLLTGRAWPVGNCPKERFFSSLFFFLSFTVYCKCSYSVYLSRCFYLTPPLSLSSLFHLISLGFSLSLCEAPSLSSYYVSFTNTHKCARTQGH